MGAAAVGAEAVRPPGFSPPRPRCTSVEPIGATWAYNGEKWVV
jgi:hypothetical protein